MSGDEGKGGAVRRDANGAVGRFFPIASDSERRRKRRFHPLIRSLEENGRSHLLFGRTVPAQRFFAGENFKRDAERSCFARVKKQADGNSRKKFGGFKIRFADSALHPQC